MKIIPVLLSITFTFTFLTFGTLDANAQQLREMHPLDLNDFECLQSLQCVQNSQSLKSKGWSFIFDETVDEYARELTARMKGENIRFFAIYDKEGNMIRSNYKRKNIALPTCLLAHLTEGNYKGWQIIGSEMVMRDFEAETIEYTVTLKNNSSATAISEKFDFAFINDLHLKHQGLAKHSLF